MDIKDHSRVIYSVGTSQKEVWWSLPLENSAKLNFYGFKISKGHASFGFVIRDFHGIVVIMGA